MCHMHPLDVGRDSGDLILLQALPPKLVLSLLGLEPICSSSFCVSHNLG